MADSFSESLPAVTVNSLEAESRITSYNVCYTKLLRKALASAERDSESLSFLRLGQEITLHHHERWDGTGYPNGLKGEAIPLAARIVSLVDVYDALTSKRPYKEAYSHEEACRIILGESGHLFDPMVVAAFLRREEEFDLTRQQISQV